MYRARNAIARAARDAYDAADARLPWWAQAGHEYLRGDGIWTGSVVGWPAIDDDRKPSHSSRNFMLQKRPSPHTNAKDFERDLRFFGEKQRPEIRATYRSRMRELVARLRRQREEEQKAGLPGLMAEMDAIDQRLGEIDDRLENMDVPFADVPQRAAALLLIAAIYDRGRNDSFGASATLDALRPALTGQIREHADHAAANPNDEMWSMPFCS